MGADPLSDILSTVGPRRVRSTRLAASGVWALRFPALQRLKFVAVLRGSCWLSLDGELHALGEGDVYMLGRRAFTAASAAGVPAIDGMPFYSGAGRHALELGGNDSAMIGGSIVFPGDRIPSLFDALPSFLLMRRSARAEMIAATLIHLEAETWNSGAVGHDAALQRLTDMLMIEAVRAHVAGEKIPTDGWLRGLGDRQIGEALTLLHREVARPWSVSELAGRVGMSRSSFAARFTQLVGRPPLDYLRQRRMILAREALGSETLHLGRLAADLGYRSQSAFTQVYKRTFGHLPSHRGSRPGA